MSAPVMSVKSYHVTRRHIPNRVIFIAIVVRISFLSTVWWW